MKLGIGVLIATVAGYLAAWLVSRRHDEGFAQWMLRLGLEGSWTGPKGWDLGQLPVYVLSIARMMTGRIAPPFDLEWIQGILYLVALVVPAFLLRGTNPNNRLVMPVVLTLIGRACFHSWYEADNFEWLVMPVALVAAVCAGFCRGEPATGLASRRTGVAMLLALSAWLLIAHGKWTWELRDRKLMTAVDEATRVDRDRWRFVVNGARSAEALYLLGFKPHDENGPEEGTYRDLAIHGGSDAVFLENLTAELQAHPIPTVVITDRFVMDGMPYTAWSDQQWAMDRSDFALPGFELVRRGNPPRAFAARWTPEAASRASKR